MLGFLLGTGAVSDSNSLISTVEKSELISSISREIDRLDRRSAMTGYTSWALWAAIGLISWRAIDYIEKAEFNDVMVFCQFFISLNLIFGFIRSAFSNEEVKFSRWGDVGSGQLVRVGFGCLIYFFLTAANVYQYSGVASLGVILFFGQMTILSSCFWFMAIFFDLPLVYGGGIKKASFVSKAIFAVCLGLGGWAVFYLFKTLDFDVLSPSSDSFKISVLAMVVFVLFSRLTMNFDVDWRRSRLQRLEVELSLSKIGNSEARERYEALMLGMSAYAAYRPWIDKVVMGLEEADLKLSDAAKILKLKQLGESGDGDDSVSDALLDKVRSLLKEAEDVFRKSDRSYHFLKGYISSNLRVDIGESPVSVEASKIDEMRDKFSVVFGEISNLANYQRA